MESGRIPRCQFFGTYGNEDPTDPTCVKRRTRFIITFADCPVLWVLKLQTDNALLTMESEIIAMAHCCREFFPIIYIVTSLGKSVGLSMGDTTINVYIYEENTGALVLDRTFPTHFTPRTKHYVTKIIWFCEDIVEPGIRLLEIDTVEQICDLFTKGLPRTTFEYLRKKIMGW